MSRVWEADPHQFGQGKRHLIDDKRDELNREKTVCGRLLIATPGNEITKQAANCKICLNSILKRDEYEKQRQQWEIERQKREQEREEERRKYTQWYHSYLQTPKWHSKYTLVLERAGYKCEGCGINRATQAHHISYDHIGDEFLWELKAVCNDCHRRAHPDKDL